MALEPFQLYSNAPVNIGGSDGFIVNSDGALTSVARENGSVDWYQTGYVADEGSVPEPKETETDTPPATVVNAPAPVQNPAPVATEAAPSDSQTQTDTSTENQTVTTPDESTTPVTPAADAGSRQETS